jgi:hypothetical protein
MAAAGGRGIKIFSDWLFPPPHATNTYLIELDINYYKQKIIIKIDEGDDDDDEAKEHDH